jgi:hypothetical protein
MSTFQEERNNVSEELTVAILRIGKETCKMEAVYQTTRPHVPLCLQGWQYSAAMFIVLNTVALVFIGCSYWRMLRAVRSSGLSLRSTQERQDHALAQRFVVIVATDCLCWIPVIGVKVAALAGTFTSCLEDLRKTMNIFGR